MSALFIVDVQNGFINKFTQNLPKDISQFLDRKKRGVDYIFFFKFINKQNSSWTNLLHWYGMLNPPDTDIVDELKKYTTKDNVFSKPAYFSVFKANRFLASIKDKKITKIFVCGLDTHACVFTTAMEAFELGYDVKVIEDLCAASHGKKYHKAAIDMLKSNLGRKVVIRSTDF